MGVINPTSTRAYIRHFEFPRDMNRLGPPPPGATSFFVGEDIGVAEMTIADPPKSHLGKQLTDNSASTLSNLYVGYPE